MCIKLLIGIQEVSGLRRGKSSNAVRFAFLYGYLCACVFFF